MLINMGQSFINLLVLFGILTTYLAFVKKVRLAQFYMFAFIVFTCGVIIYIFKTVGVLPSNIITEYGVQLGSAMQIVIISLSLADRINVMQKELAELNEGLESQVEKRTEELKIAMDELAVTNSNLVDINLNLETKTAELEKAQSIARKDMNMAGDVQVSLFHKDVPELDGWDLAFVFKTFAGVSGDLYDFYSDNNTLQGLAISDVSGHGIASGLVTMIARPIYYRNFTQGRDLALNDIMGRINKDLINEITDIDNYLTAILLRINGDNVEYVNAGHPDIIIKRALTGSLEYGLGGNDDARGSYLGLKVMESSFQVVNLSINADDTMLLYTDCLNESRNSSGEEYGFDRIQSSFKEAPNGTAEEILAHIINDFYSFIDFRELNDDLTVIIAKRTM